MAASGGGVFVQFIEIYNGKIRDLLHPNADSSAFRVREHPQAGPYVDNLVPVEVRVPLEESTKFRPPMLIELCVVSGEMLYFALLVQKGTGILIASRTRVYLR